MVKGEILLVPIGTVPPEVCGWLMEALPPVLDCTCRMAPAMPHPAFAWSPRRAQYSADAILAQVEAGEAKYALAIADLDLYVPQLNFVFGLADRAAARAIIALPRLRQKFFTGLPDDASLFRGRVVKEAVHELGHVPRGWSTAATGGLQRLRAAVLLVPGGLGWCRTRETRDGKLVTLIYGAVSSLSANPIEKKPFYHFYPGTSRADRRQLVVQLRLPVVPELGHQQGAAVGSGQVPLARAVCGPGRKPRLPGHIHLVQRADAVAGMVAGRVSPGAARGLYNTYVTNGYMTPEALELLIDAGLDAMNVDVKGDAAAVRKFCKGVDVEKVWATCQARALARRARRNHDAGHPRRERCGRGIAWHRAAHRGRAGSGYALARHSVTTRPTASTRRRRRSGRWSAPGRLARMRGWSLSTSATCPATATTTRIALGVARC